MTKEFTYQELAVIYDGLRTEKKVLVKDLDSLSNTLNGNVEDDSVWQYGNRKLDTIQVLISKLHTDLYPHINSKS